MLEMPPQVDAPEKAPAGVPQMQISKLAVIVLLSIAAYAQTAPLKPKSELAALREERDQLKAEVAMKNQLIDALLDNQFSPIRVGTRTFHSEQEFIDEFNRLTEKYNASLDRAEVPSSVFVTAPQLPHVPVGTESRIPIAPPPIYCNTTGFEAGGLVSASTNCN